MEHKDQTTLKTSSFTQPIVVYEKTFTITLQIKTSIFTHIHIYVEKRMIKYGMKILNWYIGMLFFFRRVMKNVDVQIIHQYEVLNESKDNCLTKIKNNTVYYGDIL